MSENRAKIDILYLSEKDMIEAGVLDGKKCVDVIGEVLALCSDGDFIMGGEDSNSHGIAIHFPKEPKFETMPKSAPDFRYMAMPAYLGGDFHMVGQKWYGSNKNNTALGLPRSILMLTLNEAETGIPLAYMSGNLESAMRTGAVPFVAAKHLVKKDASVISFIGAGVIATACLRCAMAVIPGLKKVKIKAGSVDSPSAKKFVKYINENYPEIEEVVVCETLEEAVRDADIINEAVSVKDLNDSPTIMGEWIKPGAVILSSMNLVIEEDFFINNTTKVVDNLKTYEEFWTMFKHMKAKEGKDRPSGCVGVKILDCIKKGIIKEEDVTWIGELVRGTKKGRTSDDEIFVVGAIGMPIEDVGLGKVCYEEALRKGIGTKLNLWDEPYLC